MKKVIGNRSINAAKLLLCLNALYGSSCTSLKNLELGSMRPSKQVLQVAIEESDFRLFMASVQQLNLRPIDVREEVFVTRHTGTREFWITFRFAGRGDLLVASSKVMGLGMVKAISYQSHE